jgi:hypothetical protein
MMRFLKIKNMFFYFVQMGIGIYAEDENKFIFNNVIVGRTAKARFKLSNTNKVNLYLYAI